MKILNQLFAAYVAFASVTLHVNAGDTVSLLNVSYDPTRELYQEFNTVFAKHYKETKGVDIKLKQSHGGSGKQARSVLDGLEADVVTRALDYDIDILADKGLVGSDGKKHCLRTAPPIPPPLSFLSARETPKASKIGVIL